MNSHKSKYVIIEAAKLSKLFYLSRVSFAVVLVLVQQLLPFVLVIYLNNEFYFALFIKTYFNLKVSQVHN